MAGEVDRQFPTGSAAKLLVLLAPLLLWPTGRLEPSTRVAVEASYRDAHDRA